MTQSTRAELFGLRKPGVLEEAPHPLRPFVANGVDLNQSMPPRSHYTNKNMALGVERSAATLGDLMSWGELMTVQESDSYANTGGRWDHEHRRHAVETCRRALEALAELAARGRQREERTRVSPRLALAESAVAK